MKNIFIYPTDTVWGIGGNPFEIETYELIAKIKGTSINKPLSILTNDIQNIVQNFRGSESLDELFDELFKYQITVGIPKASLKISFPSGPFDETNYICFRVIQNEIIDECIKDFPGFITSTSLNLTGEDPISDSDEANLFWQKHCPKTNFISSEYLVPSGKSSTIVFISGLSAKIIREGEDIQNILKTLDRHGINY
ncbi:telomere recombination domain protein [Bacteriovorax sp. BAL6_X]|uniref:Sua5/YciO/YrdC/YwlC family protein n=1 Tax=Bacteriovorax sp. BAL6_X TaxID=1201290 RepID=UPI000386C0DC|nr:Sua5/YciO/YrdC/YwlC family protein [Bacteriovorax sp. BAL6_X]EPZ49318.1 telomere recombination domain protein [Bacteriovorax sp. BAL6_X]